MFLFLGASKHLYNWLCPSVGLSVTHSFDDPHVAPYWPTWPCFFVFRFQLRDCGQRLESEMRVLTDVSTKNHEALEGEMTSTRALALAESRFKEEQLMTEIRAKWDRRFQIELEKPTEMQRLWDEQLQG